MESEGEGEGALGSDGGDLNSGTVNDGKGQRRNPGGDDDDMVEG